MTVKMDHTDLWAAFSREQYGERFIRELATFLRHESGGRSILECGCGDGRILRGLFDEGFAPCTGIDIDNKMLERAHALEQEGLEFKKHDWLELDRLPETFDTVMCRGGSLMYASGWNDSGRKANISKSDRIKSIRMSVENMLAKVKPGGVFYTDVNFSRSQNKRENQINLEGKVEYKRGEVNLRGNIECDYEQQLRYIQIMGTMNGEPVHMSAVSHLLTRHDLVEILEDVGVFEQQIFYPEMEHEHNFDVVCVRKNK